MKQFAPPQVSETALHLLQLSAEDRSVSISVIFFPIFSMSFLQSCQYSRIATTSGVWENSMITRIFDWLSVKCITCTPLVSLRVKLLKDCQWRCGFCHQEGNPHSGRMDTDAEFRAILERFKAYFGFHEVHFTGGEPSLHPKIGCFIDMANATGYRPKMTTNGQFSEQVAIELGQSGLAELNMSMHTLDPVRLARIQNPARSEKWGAQQIQRQFQTFAFIRKNFPSISRKVNTVISNDLIGALKVMNYCRDNDILWRPINDLYSGETAYRALAQLIKEVNGTPTEINLVQGSSSFSLKVVTGDGFAFNIKLIRPYRLSSMCGKCALYARGECFEYAYGPRVERLNNSTVIRSCIHKSDHNQVMSVAKYFESDLCKELHRSIVT